MKIYKSNNYGDMEVIKQEGRRVTVRFLNTGFTRKALMDNVRVGKVKDTSVKYEAETEYLNLRKESNTYGWFIIIWKKSDKCLVKFEETGTTKIVEYQNARVGKVRDPYLKTTYSVGCLGELDKRPSYYVQASQLWRNMLKRCYSQKDPRGYFGKAFVSERWLTLSNFVEDLPKLEGFSGWLEGQKGGGKFNLDKDTILEGNSTYSKDLCRFLPEAINKAITSKTSRTVLDSYLKDL